MTRLTRLLAALLAALALSQAFAQNPGVSAIYQLEATGKLPQSALPSTGSLNIQASDIATGVFAPARVPYQGILEAANVPLDGTTDASSAFSALLTSVGTTVTDLQIHGPLYLNSNITIPSNIHLSFFGAGRLIVGANKTVTINGPIRAGPQFIFDTTASNAVVTGKPLVTVIYPEWFGAKHDDVNDDTAALQKAAKLAADAGYVSIHLAAGTYKITSTVYANGANSNSFYAPTWIGVEEYQGTFIDGASLGSGVPLFSYVGAGGRITSGHTDNIDFIGSGTTTGIRIQGLGGYQFRHVRFTSHTYGLEWANTAVGTFTEYVTCNACKVDGSVTTAGHYTVSAGNNSFNGSGFADRTFINASATGPVVLIDTGTNVYNAPFDAQIWSVTGSITIFQNNTTAAPFNAGFAGQFSMETTAGVTTTLGAGRSVYFAGPVQVAGLVTSTGSNVVAGTFMRVKTMQTYADSTYSFTGAEQGQSLANLTSGVTLVPSNMKSVHRLVDVNISASNYARRFTVDVDFPNTGSGATPVTVATRLGFDSNGWGSPTFTGNADGTFNIVAPTVAVTFTAAFAGGETQGTISPSWGTRLGGQYNVTFSNGDVRVATLISSNGLVQWTGALSSAATTAATVSTFPTTGGVNAYIYETQLSNGIQGSGHELF